MSNWLISNSDTDMVDENIFKLLLQPLKLLHSSKKVMDTDLSSPTGTTVIQNLTFIASSSVNKSLKSAQNASPWIDSGT